MGEVAALRQLGSEGKKLLQGCSAGKRDPEAAQSAKGQQLRLFLSGRRYQGADAEWCGIHLFHGSTACSCNMIYSGSCFFSERGESRRILVWSMGLELSLRNIWSIGLESGVMGTSNNKAERECHGDQVRSADQTILGNANQQPLDLSGNANQQPLDLSVKSNLGNMLLFWSMKQDAFVDPLSLHGGCPVIKGNKWSSTNWMHVHGYKASAF
uniref:Prolyl 4-hydroxylase alpha subunit Fe(2+) 2OG dioxygenase domain-containing protein n=1 Tax=Oryza brachyantha TaxID=4533 RepID=J3LWF1_ORYBR